MLQRLPVLEAVFRWSQITAVSRPLAHQSVCCVIDLAYAFVFHIIPNCMVKFLMPSDLVLSETVILAVSSISYFIDLRQQCSGIHIPLRFWIWLLLHRFCLRQQVVQMFHVWWMSAIAKNSKIVISSPRNKCILSLRFLQLRTMKWDKMKEIMRMPYWNKYLCSRWHGIEIPMRFFSGQHCQWKAELEQVQQLLKLGG